MKFGFDPDGQKIVTGYDPGDLVALFADQVSEFTPGRAGDWGKVKAVDSAGRLTIQIAGFSAPVNAAVTSLSGVPSRIVRPCDARGRAVQIEAAGSPFTNTLWSSRLDRRT